MRHANIRVVVVLPAPLGQAARALRRRRQTSAVDALSLKLFRESGYESPFRWQILFVDDRNHNIIRIHHFGQVNSRNLRKKLVRVEFGYCVVLVQPADEFGKRQFLSIIERTIGADRHQ